MASSNELPASDVRRRALQRAVDEFGEDVLGARLAPASAPTIAGVLREGTPIVAPAADVLRGLMAIDAAREAQERLGARALAVVPLESSGERVGALIGVCGERPTTDQLRMFGAHVATALVKLRQETAARERTVLDIVRSVFDARKIESELQKEIARAQRYKHEVSIVVIEATNVRLLRERFGEFLTDQLVQRLGGALAESARDIDVIGAFKESGYTMILTQATSQNILPVAERLLRTAQETRLEDDVPGLELHLVCGWATCPNDGTTTEAMFSAAEGRMYGTARVA